MTPAPPTIPPPPLSVSKPAAPRMTKRQNTLLALAASLILVVISAATLLVVLPDTPPPARSITPTAAPHAVALSTTPLPSPPALAGSLNSWANGNLAFAQAIAFAPEHPQTGYACGSAGQANHTIALGITRDGGSHWTALETTAKGDTCRIRISNSDQQQVAFTATTCGQVCATSAPAHLYRSADGGTTWTQVFLPDNASFALPLAWANGTLFAATTTSTHPLAVSVQGGVFAFADDSRRFSPQPTTLMQNLIGARDTMFAIGQPPTAPTTPTVPPEPSVIESANDGAIWSLVDWHDTGLPVTFLQVASDGHTLLGQEADDTLVVSADLGQTWQGMTPFAAGTQLAEGVVDRLPHGALLATLHDSNTNTTGLYTLAPSSGAWTRICAVPTGLYVVAVTRNAAGNPTVVWAAPQATKGAPTQLRVYQIG